MAINHADTTDIHLFAYVAASDPGAVGSGKAWVDTSGATKVLKVRNAANTGWDTVGSAGVAIGNTVTGATQGSILFAGASGALSQDNTGLFWDSTNKKLTITTAGMDDGLILKNANTNYGPFLAFKYNGNDLAGRIQPDYNGGLKINANTGKFIELGGFINVPGKLMVQGYSYETSGTSVLVQSLNAGVVGLGIKLAASQTSDALQILNNADAVLTKINKDGGVELSTGTTQGLKFGSLSGSFGGLIWRGSGYMGIGVPSGEHFYVFNSSGSGLMGVSADTGKLFTGGNIAGTQFSVSPQSAGTIGQIIKLAVSHTADALKIEDSSGNRIFSINSTGSPVLKTGTHLILSEASGSSLYHGPIGVTIYDAFNSIANFSLYNRSYFYNVYGSFDSRGVFNLTKGTATDITSIVLSALTAKSGMLKVSVEATDGTDIQCLSQILRWEAVNKNGIYTTNIAVVSEGSACSTGTISATWSITTQTNQITFRCNSNPSITPTTHQISVQHIGHFLN